MKPYQIEETETGNQIVAEPLIRYPAIELDPNKRYSVFVDALTGK